LTARLSVSRQQNHNPQGNVPCSLASSLRMVVPLLTTTSRRGAPFTWCCVSRKACRYLSRPSLVRRPVFDQVAASPTCFPLEEPVYASLDKSPPRTTSPAPTSARGPGAQFGRHPPTRTNERISTSCGDNSWRPCRRPAPTRASNLGLTSRATITSPSISRSTTRKTQPEALKHPLRRAQA
jgi:hypothetical protein